MSYENPDLPQDVNVGRDHPLPEFLRLAAGLAVVVVALSALLYVAGGWLARLIPFETESGWVGARVLGVDPNEVRPDDSLQTYLQTLSDRLAAQMALPEGMRIRVHVVDEPVPNAFASLGGHVAVTRGLYERMSSENALALVLAHEIAHVRARDPIAGLGGGTLLAVAQALLTGNASGMSAAFASVVQRGYSRRAEAQADEAAVAALRAVYGHAGGGAAVFETLSDYRRTHGGEAPSLLSTHPLDADRIARLRAAAEGWDAQRQPLQPLAVPPPAP